LGVVLCVEWRAASPPREGQAHHRAEAGQRRCRKAARREQPRGGRRVG
jgi:hypothetical protein